MHRLPSVAPFAGLLTDLTTDLCRGNSCLLTADKGWTHLLFQSLRARLQSTNFRFEYVDGRPEAKDKPADDVGVMLTAITQLRRMIRGASAGVILALPHLDVMTAGDGGWTSISREVVPLLYERPEVVLLGFRDPTLTLLPVVEKLFPRRYTVEQSYWESVTAAVGDGPETPDPNAPSVARPPEA